MSDSITVKGYEIIKSIGSGGMSTVYEAIDKKLMRTVALKVLHPHLRDNSQATERFKREALAAAKLDHPNIVRVYDYIAEGAAQCIVMEYVPGLDMETIVRKLGGVPFPVAYAVMHAVANALKEAHANGIIHRDIKPSNILLHRNNRVLLSDFGMARNPLESHLTLSNAVAGTPCFMSPEQIAGKDLFFSCDIYSWAVSFYFLLSAGLPYREKEFAQIISSIHEGHTCMDETFTAQMPPKVHGIVQHCFLFDPKERIQDGSVLLGRMPAPEALSQEQVDNLLQPFALENGDKRPVGDRMPKTMVYHTPSHKLGMEKLVRALITVGIVAALAAGIYYSYYTYVTNTAPPASHVVNEPDVPEKPVERPSAAERAALAAPRAPVVRASGMRKPRIAREQAIVSDSGQLFIFSNPWANIKIDGKQISRTPMAAPLTLVTGKHRV